jgi:hypothetical protein
VLVLLAGSLLAGAGYFFYQKFTQPTLVFEYLPAEETFLAATLVTDPLEPEAAALATLFPGDLRQLLPVSPEVLPLLPEGLLGRRTAVAYLGQTLQLHRWVVVQEVTDAPRALAALQESALTGELLGTQIYLGEPLYFFPRSRQEAFAFLGSDLVWAADLETLRSIVAVARGGEPSVAQSAGYRAVLTRLDPRAVQFFYFNQNAARELVTRRLTGSMAALARPLADLPLAGGAELAVGETGVTLRSFLPLRHEYAATGIFAVQGRSDYALLPLAEPTGRWVLSTSELAAAVQHLASRSELWNAAVGVLLLGSLDRLAEPELGAGSYEKLLAPLLQNEMLVGQSSTGVWYLAAQLAPEAAENLPVALVAALEQGTWATREKTLLLPDGTQGTRLLAAPELTRRGELVLAGEPVQYLEFGGSGQSVYYAVTAEGWLLAAGDRNTLESLIIRSQTPATTPLSELASELAWPTADLYLTQLTPEAVSPLWQRVLAPFRYLAAGVHAEDAGVSVYFYLLP